MYTFSFLLCRSVPRLCAFVVSFCVAGQYHLEKEWLLLSHRDSSLSFEMTGKRCVILSDRVLPARNLCYQFNTFTMARAQAPVFYQKNESLRAGLFSYHILDGFFVLRYTMSMKNTLLRALLSSLLYCQN